MGEAHDPRERHRSVMVPMGAATTPETPAKVGGASMEAIGMVVVPMRIRIIGVVIIRVGVSIRIAVIILPTPIRGASSHGNNQTQQEQITGLHRVCLTFSRSDQPLQGQALVSLRRV